MATELRTNVFVSQGHSIEFVENVQSSLDSIEKSSIGKRLLHKIAQTSHCILIKQDEGNSYFLLEKDNARVSLILYPGTSSTDSYISTNLEQAFKPSWVNLTHELIHAYHSAKHKNVPNTGRSDGMVWSTDEEYHTIMGFPSKKTQRTTPKITENALLAELGLPERLGHCSFESIQRNPILQERMKLTAEIYRRTCMELNYKGQRQAPPPPIIDLTPQDLAPSDQLVLCFRISKLVGSEEHLSVFLRVSRPENENSRTFVNNFVRSIMDPDDCPSEFQFQNVCPSIKDVTVKSLGIYRLSSLEAAVLDQTVSIQSENLLES